MVPENSHWRVLVIGISKGERVGCPKRQSTKPKLEFLKRLGGPLGDMRGVRIFYATTHNLIITSIIIITTHIMACKGYRQQMWW